MAAILRDSTVVVAVVRTRPRAIPLSMINHEKIHTWVSFSYMVMGLRLAALRAAGAPLLDSIGKNRSSIRPIRSIWRIEKFLDDLTSRVFYRTIAPH